MDFYYICFTEYHAKIELEKIGANIQQLDKISIFIKVKNS